MSRATMLLFPASGPYVEHAEYSNSWRGATLIWSAFAEQYAGERGAVDPMTMRRGPEVEKFWALTKDPTISRAHRLVLGMTYDRVLIRRTELLVFADAIESFVSDLPLKYGAGHLLPWARAFRELATREDVVAVGFIATSVADDVWLVRDEDPESEECRPWDLSRDTGHKFVSDQVPASDPVSP